jgi:hypothetical protein
MLRQPVRSLSALPGSVRRNFFSYAVQEDVSINRIIVDLNTHTIHNLDTNLLKAILSYRIVASESMLQDIRFRLPVDIEMYSYEAITDLNSFRLPKEVYPAVKDWDGRAIQEHLDLVSVVVLNAFSLDNSGSTIALQIDLSEQQILVEPLLYACPQYPTS